ncbi:hypothetical protein LJR071_001022 [Pseudomonas sp. LjRoot71]|uniref:Fic family protein n=1 Tax=Pseudomonas sp. LjRoot71 TaxID=3342336 RepID=UPI003ECDF5F7
MSDYQPPLTFTAAMFALVADISEQVARLLVSLPPGVALRSSELMLRLDLSYRPTFTKNYLKPALQAGLIEMTDPASPRSPVQQYRRISG